MKFKSNITGGFVEPPPGMTREAASAQLPKKLQRHPKSMAFVDAVIDAAADFFSIYGDRRTATAGDVRNAVQATEAAARDMRHVLSRELGNGCNAFEFLSGYFVHAPLKPSGEWNAPTFRRAAPGIADSAPELPELLTRIYDDLTSLIAGCSYAAERLTPERNVSKQHELLFAKAVARCYFEHFGELPPKKGSFAPFVKKVGGFVGLDIGSAVTAAAVESVEAESVRSLPKRN